MAIVAVDKCTHCTPHPSPLPLDNAARTHTFAQAKAQVPPSMVNRAVKEDGPPVVRKVRPDGGSTLVQPWRSRRERMMKVADLGFRISEVILCLISFSVMAADKTQGWSGDSFDRYKEYRYYLFGGRYYLYESRPRHKPAREEKIMLTSNKLS